MLRNLLPKIILGVILILLALHFTVSNVSIAQEKGEWPKPHFSFGLGKSGSSASVESEVPEKAPEPETDASYSSAPPSMWDDWDQDDEGSAAALLHASSSLDLDSVHTAASQYVDPAVPTGKIVAAESTIDPYNTVAPEATGEAVHSVVHSASHALPSVLTNPHADHGDESKLPCSELPGAEDVVLIIKTGATEVDERIPVHFNTTLRCFPNSLVYADYSEDYEGHLIHDALGNVIDILRLKHDDFDLWRRLNKLGRTGLDPKELSINDHGSNLGGGGNPDNGGWRLDKFKNIPMVNYTINRYPDAKWFIYTDADTYVMWSNLLKWTQMMDSTKLLYLGSPAVIDDQVFAHGGSGYVISNALMHKAAEAYNENQAEWDAYAEQHWAGDCVLATLLEKLGGPVGWAYPMIQGGDNNVMDFWETGYNRRLWCYPAMTYHHIPPHTVSSLWHFEQEWIAANSTKHINHADVYKSWYLPQLPHEREDWDNLSEDDMSDPTITDSWACRDLCQHNSTCMQWSYTEGACKLLQRTKLGHAATTTTNTHSGWMLDRINEKVAELDNCDEGDWILPEDKKRRTKRTRVALEAARKFR